MPTQSHKGLVEGRTRKWELHMDDSLVKSEAEAILRIVMECSRFLR